jgi:phospho-N-acetylmuramoyl-pentapeptide-transferase
MLYYLFDYLEQYDVPGAGVFYYISFRAAMAIITSLIISMLFGRKLIEILRRKQVGETIRDLGLEGEKKKAGTPTMGGLIILASILIPTLLFAKLHNIYIILMLIATVWLGTIGFIDDYIKVFKKDKKGLAGKFKIMGQIGIGLIVGCIMFFHPDVKMKEKVAVDPTANYEALVSDGDLMPCDDGNFVWKETRSLRTTIPFVKNNEFDYSWIFGKESILTMCLFVIIIIIIVTAVSNGANITDGLDGLATGTSAIIGTVLAIFAYLSGNLAFAEYLDIMYIPDSGEMVVFIAAFVGACIGFLWYNAHPAQVFMGDTGSLALGGIIAVFSIAIRKELLIPIFCGVFLIENLSVIMQVTYFKYTKRKYGEGRRIFLMSPLHHHYQKKGMHESKIVARFWIIGIMLAVISIVTLKLR